MLTFLLSLAMASTLGVVVYLVTSTLPYLATSPTTDPNFGNHNQCLLQAMPRERVGFAVSATGQWAAGYSGARLVRCDVAGKAEDFTVSGVTHASFDAADTLWYSRRAEPETPPELWRWGRGERPVRVGEVTPSALVGTLFGVVTLDAQGHLASLDTAGTVLGVAALPKAPPPEVQLSASADGERVAVVTGGGLFVYDAQRLLPVLAEGPCEVEFLWWRKAGHRALLECGPDAAWALELEVDSGGREAAPKLARAHSELVPKRGLYVQECEHLPCTASSP
jgi:hypothetical protein